MNQRSSRRKAPNTTRPHIQGFPPIEHPEARILILGSMPSVASLQKRQYYGHPQNLFWKIMGELIGAGPDVDYELRCDTLKAHRLALWDVLKRCTREGSLDSRIEDATAEANDFSSFFQAHPRIRRVYFNGTKAEQVFRRKVEPLVAACANLRYDRLPSTSPANASKTFAEKLKAWRTIVQ